MSAFFSFQYPNSIQILTDGGFFDDDGVLRHVSQKIMCIAGLPIAIAGRGAVDEVFRLPERFNRFVGDLTHLTSADIALTALRDYFFACQETDGTCLAEYLIAAFSERDGAQHFYVQMHGLYDHMPVFEMVNPGQQITAGPTISWHDLEHLGLSGDEIASEDFPERFGAEIMEAMRQKRACLPGSNHSFYGVGGQCDLTTVSTDGVCTKTLRVWHDPIGKPVFPAPFRSSAAA